MDNNGTQTMVIDGKVYQVVETAEAPTAAQTVTPTIVSQTPQPRAELVTQPRQAVVVVGENTYEFDRVNMTDQLSIISYGSECTKQMGELLESTAKMSVKQQKTFLSDEMLAKIVSFDEALEEARRSQEQKEGLFKRLLTKVRLGVNDEKAKKEEEMKTYEGRYNDYSKNLDLVSENIFHIGQDAVADIQLRKDIIKKMKPIIEKLEAMVEAGREDKNLFDEETLRIGEEDKTPDGQAVVSYRTQLSNGFARQLNGINKVLVMYKAQVQQYQIQQSTSMTTVQESWDFVDKTKPILQSQASVQIFNTLESERLDGIISANEAANLAVQQNAEHLVANVEKASELALNGGITMESIEAVKDNLIEGVKIIADTKKQLVKKVSDDETALNQFNAALEETEKEILAIIEGKSEALIALEETRSKGHARSLRTSSTSTRPRLGSKK